MKTKTIKWVLIVVSILVLAGYIFYWVSQKSPYARAERAFIEDFDLKLRGQIRGLTTQDSIHYLVCLKVLESNHKNYFPVHDQGRFDPEREDTEKRFFIRVSDSLAILIFNYKNSLKTITDQIRPGNLITINLDGTKGYDVYDGETGDHFGGFYIATYPLPDFSQELCSLTTWE